jgi:hypothetical protein
MPYAKGRHPGAIWKETDFQIHTPRDPQWNGPHYAGGTADTEAAREKWADDFLAECIHRGLACRQTNNPVCPTVSRFSRRGFPDCPRRILNRPPIFSSQSTVTASTDTTLAMRENEI